MLTDQVLKIIGKNITMLKKLHGKQVQVLVSEMLGV
jgi:hypothetical protein